MNRTELEKIYKKHIHGYLAKDRMARFEDIPTRVFIDAMEEALSIANVVKSLPNDDEIEQAANENADRIFGDDVESDTKWYAMQHGFTDGVEWIKNYLAK